MQATATKENTGDKVEFQLILSSDYASKITDELNVVGSDYKYHAAINKLIHEKLQDKEYIINFSPVVSCMLM